MKSNLESFKPKLRKGRVIPQGSRIIFETDDPYNQMILPMALADLVLLCSGQFSVREIVGKIYKKQRAVPFRSILMAIHVLHQGGFFENGEELVLSSDLNSWMEPKQSRWNLSWRFGQRIVTDKRSPTAYYAITLVLLILSLFGLQLFPPAPLTAIEAWMSRTSIWSIAFGLLSSTSLLLTVKYLVRGWQSLILTGKAYNVALRLSPWGLHLHVGNEANDLFENRLYTTMFYVSQILLPWGILFGASFLTNASGLEPLLIAAVALTFWELNPFVSSDGLKLIQALLLSNDRDVVSWHFESNQLIDSMNPDQRRQDQDFARICAIWGAIWLLTAFAVLHESAITFGPPLLEKLTGGLNKAIGPLIALSAWLTGVYLVVQSLVETVAASLVRPYYRHVKDITSRWRIRSATNWPVENIIPLVEALPIFSHFHEDHLRKIIKQSKILEFARRTTIIKQGDIAREIFVLLEGSVEVIRTGAIGGDEWVSEMGSVSVFGEAALVDDQARSARVVSRGRATVLLVPTEILRQTADEARSIRYLEDFRNAILVNQFFASSPVFRSLSPNSIEFLSSRGSLEYFEPGQVVFHQGDVGDSLYLILRGSVSVTVHQTHIKRLAQGNFFGEISTIENIPRTATITATESSIFFKISSDSFWEVLVQHIDLGVFLETVSESRLREDLEAVPTPRTGNES